MNDEYKICDRCWLPKRKESLPCKGECSMNKEQFEELRWWFGEQNYKPTDDNILGLQEGLIQKLAQWGILFIGVKPQTDGSLGFLLEKGGVQFVIQWWGGDKVGQIK